MTLPAEMPGDPPEGFRPLQVPSGFISTNGPIHVRRDEDGLLFGFRVELRHCNPLGVCHGGWLATMADMVLPLGAREAAASGNAMLMTVSMALDYFGPAKLGDWVEGRGEMLRRTTRLVFTQGLLRVDGAPILRASGVFRIGPVPPVATAT